MSIIDREISVFNSTTDTDVVGQRIIKEVLLGFKDGHYKSTIDKVRAGDSESKKYLPTFAMHGIFEFSRKKKQFIEASGLIILDIDDVDLDLIEDTKEDIMTAIDNASKDSFHKNLNYKHCTIEYFSRANTLDLHSKVTQQEDNNLNAKVRTPEDIKNLFEL